MSKFLTSEFEIKSFDEEGVFEGYASVFSAVDQGRDAVVPGAFRKSISERGAAGVKLLWQHDPTEPIGQIEELKEDARGLMVRARLNLSIQRAREALSLMRQGVLDGLSIGYKTLKSRTDDPSGVRHLIDVDLWEVSLVTFPMQTEARISGFKSAHINTIRDYESFLRDAGGFSRTEAKALAAHGFRGTFGPASPITARDAQGGDDWAPIVAAITEMEARLTN